VISRVADHCFWFGRYLDRAESTARLLQATRTLVFDADIPVTQCWQPLVIVSGELPSFKKRYGMDTLGDGEAVQRYMTWELDNHVSIHSSVRAARDSARQIRDVISLECWEEINELFLWLELESTKQLYQRNREEFFRHVRRSTQLCLGIVRGTMLHEEPMRFLWLGTMLERVGQTARILDMHHHTMAIEAAHDVVQVAVWLSLLRACSGAEVFMKKNQGRVTAQSVAQFLLFEPAFPRSLRYCLRSARSILSEIWPSDATTEPVAQPMRSSVVDRRSPRRTEDLCDWLDERAKTFASVNGIHELLTTVVDEIGAICMQISAEIQGPTRSKLLPAGQSQSQTQTAT
jgi:uncharacterized alpha-E superfamily protein